MTEPSTTICGAPSCLVIGVTALLAIGGCGSGRPASPDSGSTSDDSGSTSDDSGSTSDDSGSTSDSGSGAAPAHFTATVSGAQNGSYDYTESHSLSGNYVSCSNPGFLAISAAIAAGNDPSFTIYLHGYTGPGTYNETYSLGSSSNPSVDVRTGAGYAYQFSFDTSRIDFHDVYSTCTFVVSGSATHISGTIECMNLTADITSPDYQMPQTDLQPVVALSATFDCDVM